MVKTMTLDVGTRLGRSEIRSQLGAGGMGEVYLAQDSQLDRTMALKILPADVASQAFLKLWARRREVPQALKNHGQVFERAASKVKLTNRCSRIQRKSSLA